MTQHYRRGCWNKI